MIFVCCLKLRQPWGPGCGLSADTYSQHQRTKTPLTQDQKLQDSETSSRVQVKEFITTRRWSLYISTEDHSRLESKSKVRSNISQVFFRTVSHYVILKQKKMRDRKISHGSHGDNWLVSSRWIWQTEVLEWPEEKQIQKGMCNQGRALLQFQQTMHTLESRFPKIKQLRWPSSVALITVSRKQKKKWIHACSVSHSVSQLRGFLPLCTGTLNPELLCLWAFAAGPCNSIPGGQPEDPS